VNHPLTIVGASVRAAAQSARRGGFDVHAGDLFADRDLRCAGQATAVSVYPGGLAAVVAGPQAGSWMYTGALENFPDLVAKLSTLRPLCGNRADVLRAIRDPWQVARALQAADLPVPALARQDEPPPREGCWIRKPLASAGGTRVVRWDDKAANATSDGAPAYFQELVDGRPCSAVFLAARGGAVLLGVTRQLIGEAWCGASQYGYCGSVGPLRLSRATLRQFEALGDCLARCFDLVGLLGVDAVMNERGVWPVEVNPRYTASTEVLDWSYGFSAVALHVEACELGRLPTNLPPPRRWCGKAIVYATERVVMGDASGHWLSPEPVTWPEIADIPSPQSVMESGGPIVTVLASGADAASVLDLLKARAAQVRQSFCQPSSSALH
jgi:predicted ATP-grasp superfamily ATP-dependent carboligase